LYGPELLEETIAIADRVDFSLRELRYKYPYALVPEHETPASHLRAPTAQGLRWRWPEGAPAKARRMVDHERALSREPENGPDSLWPEHGTPASHLRALTEQGLRWRWPEGAPDKVRRMVEHELALIRELEYEPYFLTVHDIVRFARERGILCQGRGSAANSAV